MRQKRAKVFAPATRLAQVPSSQVLEFGPILLAETVKNDGNGRLSELAIFGASRIESYE